MKPRLLILSFLLSTVAWSAESATPAPALVARGQYLVEGIGLCADCHTPRDEQGRFVTAHWLRGAPIGFTPAAAGRSASWRCRTTGTGWSTARPSGAS